MIGVVVAALMLMVLVYVVKITSVPGRDDRMMRLMVGGYLLRIFISLFSRDFSFFSHGGGGDWYGYEIWAVDINRYWSFSGIEFITADVWPEIGPTALPANLFALIVALNGGDSTPVGCTAVVACLACLACLNAYHLGIDLGGDSEKSHFLTALFLFSPAYILYTSDMYKDGLVIFAATAAIGSGLRLARRISLVHAAIGVLSLWALWYIRFYLVFVTVAPLFVGLTGMRTKSSARPLFAVLLMGIAFIGVVATTDVLESVSDKASSTFARGTDQHVKDGNAGGGSGVTFDDGGDPLAAMGPKLAYQLFAPFPWAGGSVGFQIGKLDTFLWYYLMYRAWKAAKLMWKSERTTLLMLLTFIVPTTFMYATSYANVGLSLRQRLIVVLLTGVLAARSWPAKESEAEPEPEPERKSPLAGPGGRVLGTS